jgi:glycosidase
MGIEILWLMPITPISVEKRKGTFGSYYAASSYTDIDTAYGTADDFIELIKTAHFYEMKVIIDQGANHTAATIMYERSNILNGTKKTKPEILQNSTDGLM